MKTEPITNPHTWLSRAETAITHGALTNSKRPSCFVKGVYPTHLSRGMGGHVWDSDGKRYVDFICGLGSNLFGYGNSDISAAVIGKARDGFTLSLSSTLEVEAAEAVKTAFPMIESLRFLKTGSDACTAALRIARAYTGRGMVLSEGYHGWHNEFVSLTPPALGISDMHYIEKFTNPEQITKNIAAVIIEPIITDWSEQRVEWLRAVRAKCTETGTVLVFDEMITGLRFPKLSVALHYDIIPDLICLGKAIGGGMPVSVIGGKRAVMECGEWFISSTFAGELLSLAACKRALELATTKFRVEHLWESGKRFLAKFNGLYPENLRIEGYPTRGVFVGDETTKALFFQEACKANILFGSTWYLSYSHLDLLDQVLSTSRDIFLQIRAGEVKLEGEMPRSPFAQKMRESK